MAFTGNPGKVLISSTGGDTLDGRFAIDNIRWVGAGAAGDDAIVKNGAGDIIFQAKASGANAQVSENYQGGLFVDGLDVDTLDSGTLLFTMR